MAIQETSALPLNALRSALPPARVWRRVLLVVNGAPDPTAGALAREFAQRDGSSLILFDTTADSFWASPFPPGEGIRPLLLAEGDLRRVGRGSLADHLTTLRASGIDARAHVSTAKHGEDVAALIRQEGVDLVLCPVAIDGRFMRSLTEGRQQGAALLHCEPESIPSFHPPLADGESAPSDGGIQLRFLFALILTFFAALFRNRSRP